MFVQCNHIPNISLYPQLQLFAMHSYKSSTLGKWKNQDDNVQDEMKRDKREFNRKNEIKGFKKGSENFPVIVQNTLYMWWEILQFFNPKEEIDPSRLKAFTGKWISNNSYHLVGYQRLMVPIFSYFQSFIFG